MYTPMNNMKQYMRRYAESEKVDSFANLPTETYIVPAKYVNELNKI